jgi:hypothetical protein
MPKWVLQTHVQYGALINIQNKTRGKFIEGAIEEIKPSARGLAGTDRQAVPFVHQTRRKELKT